MSQMLMALDANAKSKSQSNRRYARALMEVFCLGTGNVTDEDIEETARALTGWLVRRDKLRFVARAHDTGVKQILSQEGKLLPRLRGLRRTEPKRNMVHHIHSAWGIRKWSPRHVVLLFSHSF